MKAPIAAPIYDARNCGDFVQRASILRSPELIRDRVGELCRSRNSSSRLLHIPAAESPFTNVFAYHYIARYYKHRTG